MIKAVLIDIDNTLLSFDGYVKATLKEGFKRFELAEYEDWMYDVFTRINLNFWHGLEKGEVTFEDIERDRFNAVFKEIGIEYDGPTFEKYFRECLNDSAIVMDGAMELLRYLKGRYILCSASNGPYYQQTNRLRLASMLDFFDMHFISEEVGYSKPSEEFFKTVMERLNEKEKILSSECVIIGDSITSDMTGGKRCGMVTCWFNPDGLDVPDGMKLDYVIKRFEEVEEFI